MNSCGHTTKKTEYLKFENIPAYSKIRKTLINSYLKKMQYNKNLFDSNSTTYFLLKWKIVGKPRSLKLNILKFLTFKKMAYSSYFYFNEFLEYLSYLLNSLNIHYLNISLFSSIIEIRKQTIQNLVKYIILAFD